MSKSKREKRACCAWARCKESPCDDSLIYCRAHLAESSKTRRHSCMADDCNKSTGGADKLYCREHEQERKLPEHRRPETTTRRVALHVGVDGVLCEREGRPAGRRPREADGVDDVEAEAWEARMSAARGSA